MTHQENRDRRDLEKANRLRVDDEELKKCAEIDRLFSLFESLPNSVISLFGSLCEHYESDSVNPLVLSKLLDGSEVLTAETHQAVRHVLFAQLSAIVHSCVAQTIDLVQLIRGAIERLESQERNPWVRAEENSRKSGIWLLEIMKSLANGAKGLHDLFRLIQTPCIRVLMMELDAGPGVQRSRGDEHSRQPIADGQTFEQLAARRNELLAEIERIDPNDPGSDLERRELQEELEKIETAVKQMKGLDGKARDLNNNDVTRMRSKISERIRTACNKSGNDSRKCYRFLETRPRQPTSSTLSIRLEFRA